MRLTILVPPPQLASYKGTFDTIQPFSFYRSEMHRKDTLWMKFVFGDVFVNDSTSSTYRQVKLYFGQDTNGFASGSEERDSTFRTEWFNVPIGSQITYFRGMYFPMRVCDSVHNSLTDPSINVHYVVQLVHISGAIDTLETMTFTPGNSDPMHPVAPQYILPTAAHTPVHVSFADTVQLRVVGSIAGFVDADSLTSFEMESAFDKYDAELHTTVSYKSGSGSWLQGARNRLDALGPFPNPSGGRFSTLSALVRVPIGLQATIEFVDAIGRTLNSTKYVNGGAAWQRVEFSVPKLSGNYFLRIVAGNEEKLLPISVLR